MTQQNRFKMMATFVLLLLSMLVLIPVNRLHAAVATSRVVITKIAALTLEKLDTDHLYRSEAASRLTSTACVRAGGEPMPFRVSAASLGHAEHFALKSLISGEQVPYRVIWSNGDDFYALEKPQDVTDVQQVSTDPACQESSLSVIIDDKMYAVAANGQYVDTLSLILVVE